MIKVKRIYMPASPEDGFRILVERLWPRGVSKERAAINAWLKEIAPSPELRKWYAHDTDKWEEFQQRYQSELSQNPDAVNKMISWISHYPIVTFVIASKDETHSSAAILLAYLQTLSGE